MLIFRIINNKNHSNNNQMLKHFNQTLQVTTLYNDIFTSKSDLPQQTLNIRVDEHSDSSAKTLKAGTRVSRWAPLKANSITGHGRNPTMGGHPSKVGTACVSGVERGGGGRCYTHH